MKTLLYLSTCMLVFLLLFSCVDDVTDYSSYKYPPSDHSVLSETLDLPEVPFNYSLELPEHIARQVFPRRVSNNRATLGRVLFYDKNLSRNGTVSCASCHKQELAFSDDVAFSKGFEGVETSRNSIALGSVLGFAGIYGSSGSSGHFGTAFFWDERAHSASEQSLLSLTDNVEMGMTSESLLNTVKSKDYYKILFKTAYRDGEITEEKILLALESFIDGIGSFKSKLDDAMIDNGQVLQFEDYLPGLTQEENNGKTLFVDNCMVCHGTQFTATHLSIANNGLDLNYADKGVGALVSLGNVMDGVFKVPALRNVQLTAPYMHDGRFSSLKEVIDFYSSGIQDHHNLSEHLKGADGRAIKFNFSEKEKDELITFLNTLTDPHFLVDEKFSDPFK